MEAYFKLGGEIFYLPYINEVNIPTEYDDEEFENILGEKYLIQGKKKLMELEVQGVISDKNYPFYNIKAKTSLSDFIGFFDRARKQKEPLQFVVANSNTTIINITCLVDFSYSNLDKVGDINYSIKIKEFRIVKG